MFPRLKNDPVLMVFLIWKLVYHLVAFWTHTSTTGSQGKSSQWGRCPNKGVIGDSCPFLFACLLYVAAYYMAAYEAWLLSDKCIN